jgi:5'-3' exonuclease
MLSLASKKKGIYLLRESVHFGKVDSSQMLLLDIDALREAICTEIRGFLSVSNISDDQIVDDYLFICFLLGNDFLPHLPPLRIGEGSVDYLLASYAESLNADSENPDPGLIRSDRTINLPLFRTIMKGLAKDEGEMVTSFYQSHIRKRYREPQGLTHCESEIRKIEFMPSVKIVRDTVHFNKPGWEERYYQRYLCQKFVEPYEVDKMCENYWQGLNWTLSYYMDDCPSWHWFYHYPCSPTTRDLSEYLQKMSNEQLQKDPFPKDENGPLEKALNPDQQMLCILPPGSANLLPEKIRKLMISTSSPIKDLYPTSFNVEMLYMRYFHQAIPQLPLIDFNRICEALETVS